MPSIRTLAKLAGVSIATVSRALNGQPYVEASTRTRIIELATALHYYPNRMTQQLYDDTRRTIGVLVPNITDFFFAQVISSLLTQAERHDYHVMICETHTEFSTTLQAITTLIEQRVAGIIACAPTADLLPAEVVLASRSHDIVLITVDNTRYALPVDSIHSDEEAMARTVTDYLAQLGHRRIGYFGISEVYDHQGRARAVQASLRRLGIHLPPVCFDSFHAAALLSAWQQCAPAQRVTAFIAWNDYCAMDLLREALRQGIRIPRDLSLISYGNYNFGGYLYPALTSLTQHPECYGEKIFDLLLERARSEDYAPAIPVNVTVSASLMVRETCASPPRL